MDFSLKNWLFPMIYLTIFKTAQYVPYINLNYTLLFDIIYNKNVSKSSVLARYQRQGIIYGNRLILLSFRCTWGLHSGSHTNLNYL